MLKSALRRTAKNAAFVALGNGPLLKRRLDRVRDAGVNIILNLHRVHEFDGSSYQPLEPNLFEDLLDFICRDFAVVSFAELGEPASRPKIVLSFDDGYRDFATHAHPMMKRRGLKSNHNIIPNCTDTGIPPLNVVAQDFIGKAPTALVDGLKIDGFTGPKTGERVSTFLKTKPAAEQEKLASEVIPQFRAWEGFHWTPLMTIDEIRSLDGVEWGAHSWAHASMEFEADDYLAQDLRRCDAWFRDKLGRPMSIYAFPNGSCRKDQVDQVLDFGVKHVLVVGESFDEGHNVHRRFTFDGRTPSEVRFKALGGLAAIP